VQLKRRTRWQLLLQQLHQLQFASSGQHNVTIRTFAKLLKLFELLLLWLGGQLKGIKLLQQAAAVLQQSFGGLGQPVFRLLAATADPPQASRRCRQQTKGAGAAMEKIAKHDTTTKQG
jgi:hypothetical protein